MPDVITWPPGGASYQFEGHQYGEVGVSFFLTDGAPGSGPALHRHPYAEVFVVQEGRATFTVADSTIEACAGQIVIVPPEVPHRFVNSGDGQLRQINIHANTRMITEWLDAVPTDADAAPDAQASIPDDAKERTMFKDTEAYGGFAVDDVPAAKQFYGETLGLNVSEANGLLSLHLAAGRDVLVYPKPDHTPETFTILNFPVVDIEQAVDGLTARGVRFERYDGMDQDERGIARDAGPRIAWFTDPAGNILSVLQDA